MPLLPVLAEGALYLAGLFSASSPFWQCVN